MLLVARSIERRLPIMAQRLACLLPQR
jgi:hypothetical protein